MFRVRRSRKRMRSRRDGGKSLIRTHSTLSAAIQWKHLRKRRSPNMTMKGASKSSLIDQESKREGQHLVGIASST